MRVALSCLHAGIGQTHINNVLATIDIPPLNSCTYKQREREVGRAVECIAKTSCQDSLNRERAQALVNGCQPDDNNLVSIPCSFDMGWQKRGKGHNSRTAQEKTESLHRGIQALTALAKASQPGQWSSSATLGTLGVHSLPFIAQLARPSAWLLLCASAVAPHVRRPRQPTGPGECLKQHPSHHKESHGSAGLP